MNLTRHRHPGISLLLGLPGCCKEHHITDTLLLVSFVDSFQITNAYHIALFQQHDHSHSSMTQTSI